MRYFTDDLYNLWNSVLDKDNKLTDFRKKIVYIIVDKMLTDGIDFNTILTRNGFANAVYVYLNQSCTQSTYSDICVGALCGMDSLERRRQAAKVHVVAVQESALSPYVKFSIEYVGKPFIFDKPPKEHQKLIDGRKVFISNLVFGTNEPDEIEKVIIEHLYNNLWHVDKVVGGKTDIDTFIGLWEEYLQKAVSGDAYDPITLLFLSDFSSADIVQSGMFEKLYAFIGKTGFKRQYTGRIVFDLNAVQVQEKKDETYKYSFIERAET